MGKSAAASNPSSCAVHLLQAVGGLLLPAAILWMVEGQMRALELRRWLHEQQQQQQADGAGEAPAEPEPASDWLQLVPRHVLLAWLLGSACVLWLLMEAVLL